MAQEYDNSNRITLWPVKSDNEKAPYASGSLTLGEDVIKAVKNGETDLRVAVWKVASPGKKPFLSGNIQLNDYNGSGQTTTKKKAQVQEDDFFDDEDDF